MRAEDMFGDLPDSKVVLAERPRRCVKRMCFKWVCDLTRESLQVYFMTWPFVAFWSLAEIATEDLVVGNPPF